MNPKNSLLPIKSWSKTENCRVHLALIGSRKKWNTIIKYITQSFVWRDKNEIPCSTRDWGSSWQPQFWTIGFLRHFQEKYSLPHKDRLFHPYQQLQESKNKTILRNLFTLTRGKKKKEEEGRKKHLTRPLNTLTITVGPSNPPELPVIIPSELSASFWTEAACLVKSSFFFLASSELLCKVLILELSSATLEGKKEIWF